jgi:hypothetical protein
MEKQKVKRSALDYLPWGGQHVDPVLDPEVFAMLPGRVQRENLFIRQMVRSRTPYTLDDMIRAGKGDDIGKIEVSLHTSLTLHSLTSRAEGLTPVGNMSNELQGAVSEANIFEHCTCFGEGRRLLNSKPGHGFYAYLWALVLVQKKVLKTLPIFYLWELEEGIHQLTGKILNTRTPEAELLLTWLDRQGEFLAGCVA